MLNKIVIGTANFTKSYGILSNGTALAPEEINSIFSLAVNSCIDTFDTAFAYGDLFSVIKKDLKIDHMKIISKFSVLDNYQSILDLIKKATDQYNFKGYYAILLHDPQNLDKIDQKKLSSFLDYLREHNYAQKIGVSVYDPISIKNFNSIKIPDIIQIPLNPLNQTFINNEFLDYIKINNIEVHARSLFLQGVLLSEYLPQALVDLQPLWKKFIEVVEPYRSRLKALLSWASTQDWVHKWVIGVSSLDNLQEIINYSKNIEILDLLDRLMDFKDIKHSLTDPRNWMLT